MADYDPKADRLETMSHTVRSVGDLKKSLMRRAFDGNSSHSPAQMILLIKWRLSANNITPADQAILDDINAVQAEDMPRSILMLNTVAREAEKTARLNHGQITDQPLALQRVRFEYNPAVPNAPAPSTLQ